MHVPDVIQTYLSFSVLLKSTHYPKITYFWRYSFPSMFAIFNSRSSQNWWNWVTSFVFFRNREKQPEQVSDKTKIWQVIIIHLWCAFSILVVNNHDFTLNPLNSERISFLCWLLYCYLALLPIDHFWLLSPTY